MYQAFPRFFPMGTINFSVCKDAGTIRGLEQNEGGVNIARQRMQSRVLARVLCYDTQSSFLPAMSTAVSADISPATLPGFAEH